MTFFGPQSLQIEITTNEVADQLGLIGGSVHPRQVCQPILPIISEGGNHTAGKFITVIINNISSVVKERLSKPI